MVAEVLEGERRAESGGVRFVDSKPLPLSADFSLNRFARGAEIVRVCLHGIVGEAAADRHHWHPVLARRGGDAGGRLDAALAGDREIGALRVALELCRRDDQLDAAFQGRVGEGHEAGTHAAPCAGARPVGDLGAEVAFDDLGEVCQGFIEPIDHLRRRTLLGPINAGTRPVLR